MNTDEAWIKNAVLVSGRGYSTEFGFDLNPIHAVKKLGHAIKKTSGKIHASLTKIPVVGKPMAAIYQVGGGPVTFGIGAGAINFAASVASGDRIDKAAVGELKKSISAYNDLAPIIAMIPGVGPELTGAIASADALSHGGKITDAAIAVARTQIPGGPVAQSAFDVGVCAAQGKPCPLEKLPLSNVQTEQFQKGLNVAKDFADGKKVDLGVYSKARSFLPGSAQTALDKGFSVGLAKTLQGIHAKISPNLGEYLENEGKGEIEKKPLYKTGSIHLAGNPEAQKGFFAGLGMGKYQSSTAAFDSFRNSLPSEQKKGFDLAFSTKIGELGAPSISNTTPIKQQFGYYAAQGIQGASDKNRVALLKVLSDDPQVKKGIDEAVKRAKLNEPEGFFDWLHRIIFGEKK